MGDFDYTKGDPNFLSGQDFADEHNSGIGCVIWTIVLIVVILGSIIYSIVF